MDFFKKRFQFTGEKRYYFRDFVLLSICTILAIVLAETFIFTKDSSPDSVDRIFVYSYFIIPFFILVLFLSHLYRNFKIRQTGKIRSAIRYRLTIAFIFVSILPSIPVFILSSNVIGKLVESFYQIDIADALLSSKDYVLKEEIEDRRLLGIKARALSRMIQNKKDIDLLFVSRKALDISILNNSRYFLALYQSNKLVKESDYPISQVINPEKFKQKENELFPSWDLYKKDISYTFFKLSPNVDSEDFLIIGRRMHIGNELNAYNIINTEIAYNSTDLWKEKVPFALRLSLGIFSIGMFAVSIIVSFLLARQISRPIVLLAQATQRISKGETDVVLDLKEEGEMGIMIESFNQMTKDLKAKNEELLHIQRVAAWKEVAQRMAHEIKNPLTPIQLSAERIRRKWDNPNKEKLDEIIRVGTETIIGQVRVLEHLVKEFSEFARMPTPVLINQHLNPLVEESVNLFKDYPNIEFELKLGKNLPEVFLDKRLFLGVINNLIKNAVEAILLEKKEDSEIEKRSIVCITTRTERKFIRRTVVLQIEDSGPGISPKLQEKIFEPYFSTKEGHGMGIGLTIVQKTVYDHHGYIYVENSKLGGCNFIIELPAQETV